jgi:hypothetical protein
MPLPVFDVLTQEQVLFPYEIESRPRWPASLRQAEMQKYYRACETVAIIKNLCEDSHV